MKGVDASQWQSSPKMPGWTRRERLVRVEKARINDAIDACACQAQTPVAVKTKATKDETREGGGRSTNAVGIL